MKVVKLQHHSMICVSLNDVNGNASLNYGGAGGDHEAGSRGGDWDDEDDW